MSHPKSVLWVGGPMDGHRTVVDLYVGRIFRFPLAVPLENAASWSLEPEDYQVRVCEYEVRPIATPAAREPLYIGTFQGVR